MQQFQCNIICYSQKTYDMQAKGLKLVGHKNCVWFRIFNLKYKELFQSTSIVHKGTSQLRMTGCSHTSFYERGTWMFGRGCGGGGLDKRVKTTKTYNTTNGRCFWGRPILLQTRIKRGPCGPALNQKGGDRKLMKRAKSKWNPVNRSL